MISRHPVGDAGGLDLALGPHQSYSHRVLGHEEGSCDLPGRQAAEQPEGERHLGFGGQGRVAAGEDEAQPVVFHGPCLLGHGGIAGAGRDDRHLAEQLPPARLAAQAVDGTVAGGRGDPAARVGRQAVARPLAQGDGERLLHRVLGDVDVTEGADQGSHRPAGFLAEDPADPGRAGPGCGAGSEHCRQAPGSSWNGRTSIGAPMMALVFDAQASAASRSSASTM